MELTECNYRTIDYAFPEQATSVVQWQVKSGNICSTKSKKNCILR